MINLMNSDSTYSAHENDIMAKWHDNQIYQKIISKNKGNTQYRFMDGPPFVSSNCLHFGHLMIGFLKSTILNYNQMKGLDCLNELGYDCHGLPIEMVANKNLGVNTKKEVEEFGIDKYNNSCKEMIKQFSGAWTPIYNRIGRWANFNKTYKTMDVNFMESVWWVFSEIYKKNLIYKGYQVMPYSNACNSPLSNFEAGQNYKDVETKSVYVLFKIKNLVNTYAVAWTTTPWTLPGNLALCVNYEGEYSFVEYNGQTYICAKNLIKNLDFKNSTVIKSCIGQDLVGYEYEPVFNYMDDFSSDNKFKIISDRKNNYVTVEVSGTGTGIVHIAPYYGDDDYRVCQDNNIINNMNIEMACTIDDNGKFIESISQFGNKIVTDKETNDEIIKNLKIRNLMIRTQMYKHSYPYCYRTDTPLIYKVTSSYFIKVPDLKDDLLQNNDKVNWYPSHIGTGRFKSWLENVKDWCVSRNRFFGTPLPIWVSDDGEETVCVSSIDELVKLANLDYRPTDLHREFIDNIEIPSKQGKGMLKNVKLVLDCWFESGCVPIAQLHYPFENSKAFEDVDYLSEFIAEGLDQTRGWFYTLMVISTALFNKPAFKNVICTGLILDENGLKFSKKYGNFKDPMEILNKYGADVTRLYLLNSPTINADSLRFNEVLIERVKQQIIPYINAVKLFLTHSKDHYSKGNSIDINLWKSSKNILDKWIISTTSKLVDNVNTCMQNYKIDRAITHLINYVEDLTNMYIKLNRDRIRGLSGTEERDMSLSVFLKVLLTYVKTFAPFTPFLSEYIYDHLKVFEMDSFESIHLCNFPTSDDLFVDDDSLTKVSNLCDVLRNIRTIRNTMPSHSSIKIPIYKVIIFHNDNQYIETIKFFEEVIKDEINCLDIEYDNMADNLIYKIVPNLRNIGKKFRGDASAVKDKLINMDSRFVANIFANKIVSFDIEIINKIYSMTEEEFSIERIPATEYSSNPDMISKIDNELMVAVDKRYTEELHNTYQMRKLCTATQKVRKTSGLNPWNKILVNFSGSDKLKLIIDPLVNSIQERLICDVSVNQIIDKQVFCETKYEFEFFDELTEFVEVKIYLL